jgi:uncharacterized phage protein (TIGR02218 family)
MRTGAATKTLLENNDAWLFADVLEITPESGSVLHVTNWGTSITNGGDTFVSAGGIADCPGLEIGALRWGIGTEVSTLDLTFYINSASQGFDGEAFATLAANGGFYGATVTLWRLVSLTVGGFASADKVWLFDGRVIDVSIAGNSIGFGVQSAMARLNMVLPKRTFCSSCPYAFCDDSCGLTAATYTTARTVTAVTDRSVITVSGSIANDLYKGGNIAFTSGDLTGIRRNVLGNTGGLLTLDAPLPLEPTVTDGVDTMQGCPKTLAACTAFSNQTRFPGFPFIARSK